MKNQSKKPQGSRPGASAFKTPGRRRHNKTGLHIAQPVVPGLFSFPDELDNFIGLVTAPTRDLYFTRLKTLDGNRWLSACRVVRAAIRDGRSTQWIAPLLLSAGTLEANPPWYFNADVVSFIVTAEMGAHRCAGPLH